VADFKDYLKQTASEINKFQEQFLTQEIEKAREFSPKTVHLVEEFSRACEGGKRLRGMLVKLGYELAGGDKTEEILKPALAFEILQTSFLAHDDIIDQSITRRGRPTLYQALGGDHYAISQTICLGDVGFFLAFQLVAQSDFPQEKKNKALVYFNQTMFKTAAGQMLDVEISEKQKEFDEDDSLKISHYKTAHYTIIGPLQLGAILAGASDELLQKIEEFGKNLGIAFQIQDDILGMFGDERTLGKSVTSDAQEGKNTLLITYALKHTSAEQKQFLLDHYGKGKIDDTQFMKFKQIFQESGALDYTRTKALEYVNKAKQQIENLAQTKEQKALLEQLADYLIEREK
jgi:geranylgeranyl diphosphate synthase, type I